MARRAALVLVALLVVAASAAVVSRWSGRGVQPTFTPSYTSTTTPAQTALAPVKRVQLSPNSSIISALFVGDKLVFMNYTDRYMEGGVNYTKVLLHVLDLKTLSMKSTVELESMPISPPESVQCEKRTIFGLKRTTPEYRLLGYDGRYAYVSRYCPGEGPGYPVVYAVDTSAGVIYKSTVNAYEVAALKDGVVYYIGGLVYSMGSYNVTAYNIVEGSIVWAHNYTPSYVFGDQAAGRRFSGTILAARAGDGVLYAVLADTYTTGNESRPVYLILRASSEGVEESYVEAATIRHEGMLEVTSQAVVTESHAIILSMARVAPNSTVGKLYIHVIRLSDMSVQALEREVPVWKANIYMLMARGDRIVYAYKSTGPLVVEELRGGRVTWSISADVSGVLGASDDTIWLHESRRYIKYVRVGSQEIKDYADLGPMGIGYVLGQIITLPFTLPLKILGLLGEGPRSLSHAYADTVFILDARNRILIVVGS